MTIQRGTHFGSYQIGESIGVGGMGEVYRATDTNLKRDVAIKVLPESFAADPDRLARFQREAEVLAALNHVNIAHIYGLERSGGVTALVMELVDGQTLAERLERGALPADEALNIAMQIAEALEAAHERGIVHRDLKPANIKLASNGVVKVLDFGIAKALDTKAISGPQAAQLTTPAMTEAGIVLGTAAYMSPEQARGKAVDQRADIWAFGCLLYEMLTGQAAFGGEDVTTTLARILERGADMSALPATLSPDLRQVINLCLQKDPRKRVADIRDVKLALGGAFATNTAQTSAPMAVSVALGRLAWSAFAIAVLAAAALAVPALQHLRESAPPETRVEISTPPTDQSLSFALSPDGRQMVYVADDEDGVSRLWLRPLATTAAQPLAGTENAFLPFWSPDSRSIGFFAGNTLRRLDLGGGAPQTLAPVTNGAGGTWNADGTILFAPSVTSPLWRVSATAGGTATAETTMRPEDQGHVYPHFLPDGKRFLFFMQGPVNVAGIYLGALDSSESVRLVQSDTEGAYHPAGWVLWEREGALVAQRLDMDQGLLTGETLTITEGTLSDVTFYRSPVSIAATGLIAYRTGTGSQLELAWLDRAGIAQGTVGEPDVGHFQPRVLPDGRRVIDAKEVQRNRDLWLMDGARTTRLVSDAATDYFFALSPDGARLVFRSNRTGAGDLYEMPVDGSREAERIVASNQGMSATSWSPDGRYLLYISSDPQMGADIWVVPMEGERTPYVFLRTPYREAYGEFSPDGRWVAYQSNESGRLEIYLRRFVPPDADAPAGAAVDQWQVSSAGGIYPRWSPDGTELYFLDPSGAMMAAPIVASANAIEPGVPQMLFATRIYGGGLDNQQGRHYDVAPDGRFLINTALDDMDDPITLIQNWNPEATQ
jgi:Tol biopolymer transport system component